MRQIAIINQKGGVGKTTTCCNVGAAIAAAGHKVLLIDLDPQAHLTMHLGIEPELERPSVYSVLTESQPVPDAVIHLDDHLHLLPANIDLAAAEMELVSVMGREVILRDALARMPKSYDFVMIDCPPSLGVLTVNGLAAMNEVIVPMQPHFLALQGVGKLLETIRLVKDRINPELFVSGIALCLYDAGTRLASEVTADLRDFLEASRGTDVPWSNARVFDTIIRRNIKLAECPSHGMTIANYAPQSNGATDYAALATEILNVSNVSNVESLPITPVLKPDAKEQKPIPTPEPAQASEATETTEVTEAIKQPVEATEPETVKPIEAIALEGRIALGPDEIAVEATPEPQDAHAAPQSAKPTTTQETTASTVAPPRLSIPISYEDDDGPIETEAGLRNA